jgi:hypothetical protein
MENVPLELLINISEHLAIYQQIPGERWSALIPSSKIDVLSFRAVSKGFRDASWAVYGLVLGEKQFSLARVDLEILYQISQHCRIEPMMKSLTFGIYKFNQAGLEKINFVLQNRPRRIDSSPYHSRQLEVTNSHVFSTTKLLRLRQIHTHAIEQQEEFWLHGAVESLQKVLRSLSQLRSIRIQAGSPKFIQSRYNLHHHPSYHYLNVTRIARALSKAGCSAIEDIRVSTFSYGGFPPEAMLQNLGHLRVLKVSLNENELIADEVYKENHFQHGETFAKCLRSTPNLKVLDIYLRSSNFINFRSFILAYLSRETPCYRLEHLCLENATMNENDFAQLFKSHAATLKRLVLITPWLRPGSWANLFDTMAVCQVHLDYLELWKPSQGAVSYYQNQNWIPSAGLTKVTREGRVVYFAGEIDDNGEFVNGSGQWGETWNTYYTYDQAR